MKIVFRTELYGTFKDDVLAVQTDNCKLDIYQCYKLFGEYQLRTKKSIQQGTRVATKKEYLSLLTKLTNEGKQIETVSTLRKINLAV